MEIDEIEIKKLLSDMVLVDPDQEEEKTKSGIYIPDTAREKSQFGTVIAVGPGKYAELTGDFIPMNVKPGDRVYFNKSAVYKNFIEGKRQLIMKQCDVSAIIK